MQTWDLCNEFKKHYQSSFKANTVDDLFEAVHTFEFDPFDFYTFMFSQVHYVLLIFKKAREPDKYLNAYQEYLGDAMIQDFYYD